jgi:hypothetical protein
MVAPARKRQQADDLAASILKAADEEGERP